MATCLIRFWRVLWKVARNSKSIERRSDQRIISVDFLQMQVGLSKWSTTNIVKIINTQLIGFPVDIMIISVVSLILSLPSCFRWTGLLEDFDFPLRCHPISRPVTRACRKGEGNRCKYKGRVFERNHTWGHEFFLGIFFSIEQAVETVEAGRKYTIPEVWDTHTHIPMRLWNPDGTY